MILKVFGLVLSSVLFLSTMARAELELVHEFSRDVPPGNIAVGPDGRLFMSLHEFFGPKSKLVEVKEDGSAIPYPPNWAKAPVGDGPGLNGVLGLQVDQNGILWLLDGASADHAGRVVGWDTKSERLHRIYYLGAPIIEKDVFLNDLAIDLKNNAIYVADTGGPKNSAVIVINMETGRARRVLSGSEFTVSEDIDMVIDDRLIMLGPQPARIGINPITVDPENEWLYFGPMSGSSLYRVATKDLNDETLSEEDLLTKVQRYGDRPISDGATVDGGGNVYITDITNNAIGIVKPGGDYEVLYQQDRLSWPDGYAYGPDDKIYVVVNELHNSPVLAGGKDLTKGRFAIYKFDPKVKGAVGR